MKNLPGKPKDYLVKDSPYGTIKLIAETLKVRESRLRELLTSRRYLSEAGKPTTKAADEGLLAKCDGKILWSALVVKRAVGLTQPTPSEASAVRLSASTGSSPASGRPATTEPKWVDFETIGTYFGVGKNVVGKWLDQIGMRETPKIEKNESGEYDMLDMARQAQQKQAVGFIGKVPSERALEMGVAKILTVTNRKQQEIEIAQWNLELTKMLLVKAGHPLDTERKMALKGKGKNSDVKVNGIDARARELHIKWARLYGDPKTRWKAAALFRGQPTIILQKVEDLMKMPGYLTEGKYLKEANEQ